VNIPAKDAMTPTATAAIPINIFSSFPSRRACDAEPAQLLGQETIPLQVRQHLYLRQL
jgi:hypothetical protein